MLWYRVFGMSDKPVSAAGLLAHLRGQGFAVASTVQGADNDWSHVDLVHADGREPVAVDRYHVGRDGLRSELNTWAAWLETREDDPNHERLLDAMTKSVQVFLLRQEDEPDNAERTGRTQGLCLAACRYLAGVAEGVYQADGLGFFTADGHLLMTE